MRDFLSLKQIRNFMFPCEEPLVPDEGGAGGGDGSADPGDAGADGAGGENVDDAAAAAAAVGAASGEAAASFQVPEGKVLMDAAVQQQLEFYSQFGSPQELYNKMQHYGHITTGFQNQTPEQQAQTAEVEQVKELLYSAIPELRQLGQFMQQAQGQSLNLADAAAARVMEMATAGENSIEGFDRNNGQAAHELLTLVTLNIKQDPMMHKRFLAGDMSVVDKVYNDVLGRFYNRSAKPGVSGAAGSAGSAGSGIPPQKRNERPMKKGGVSGAELKGKEGVHASLEAAGAAGFDRIQTMRKE